MTLNTQKTIKEILELSTKYDAQTNQKLLDFLKIYEQQTQKCQKYKKSNELLLKRLDKYHNLVQKKDIRNEKLLERQSRQASMGEIIDVVAHQWKQPLNSISMLIDMLKMDFTDNKVNEEYINDLENIVHMQINHMTTTLKEFRNFLRPVTKDERFNLSDIIKNVQLLVKDELLSQNIHLNTTIDEQIELNGNKNEFKHIFLNLINNSVDAFNENDIKSRFIDIKAYLKDVFIYIEISDNAGGINDKIIDKIFNSNFTTKSEEKGTGIGLYISKQLVKKSNGTINVNNLNNGILFTIKFNKT